MASARRARRKGSHLSEHIFICLWFEPACYSCNLRRLSRPKTKYITMHLTHAASFGRLREARMCQNNTMPGLQTPQDSKRSKPTKCGKMRLMRLAFSLRSRLHSFANLRNKPFCWGI